jgi:hypothetical protein
LAFIPTLTILFGIFRRCPVSTTVEITDVPNCNTLKLYKKKLLCNIGIKGKNIGTVSKEDCTFMLNLRTENAHDTLTFSCIGFDDLNLLIPKIIREKNFVFYLHEKFIELDDVVISSKNPKIKKIGTKSANPLLWGSATSKDGKDIIEMGNAITAFGQFWKK